VFIAGSLILLFTAPFITSFQLQAVRRKATEFVSPALVKVNDLEAALATETAAQSEEVEGGGQSAAAQRAAVAARTTIADDGRALDSLVRHIDPDAIGLAAEAKSVVAAWQKEEDRFVAAARAGGAAVHGADATVTRGRRWEAFVLALTSLQKLEDELTHRTADTRREIQRLERINVLVPTALVPLALFALIAVAWTARRTLLLSHSATESRLAAEQAMAAKSALMRGITHDLKNPLGAARGYADLLVDGVMGPVPEAQTRVAVRLRSLISVTLDTVNDLVELSRADLGDLRIDRQEADVIAIARELVDDYRASGETAGVRLRFEIDAFMEDASAPLVTDPVRVRQVLGNMLSNAVKYTPRGGGARVGVMRAVDAALGPVIALEVSDDGPGIPEALRERVFEEFFRVPNTSAVAAGTGVGLAIARRVARLLGGDLRLRETVGGGATFTLLLPARR